MVIARASAAKWLDGMRNSGEDHDDIMTWGRFPHYWSFVRGIRWFPVDSTHKGPIVRSFDGHSFCQPNELFNKQSSSRWLKTPWHTSDVVVVSSEERLPIETKIECIIVNNPNMETTQHHRYFHGVYNDSAPYQCWYDRTTVSMFGTVLQSLCEKCSHIISQL